ncbi:MAG: M23 family metallopeptidase [Desulfovibrio sp.]|jgi:murein DD-endopeptidase MepM/ murein hydrolase activator NlpD|nr:M23 family metallopeptidase [Desulfovibrio sp.]
MRRIGRKPAAPLILVLAPVLLYLAGCAGNPRSADVGPGGQTPVPAAATRSALAEAGNKAGAGRQEAQSGRFMLDIPKSAGDGEAFALRFGAENAQALDLDFNGGKLHLETPSKNSGLFEALLPVPLGTKKKSLILTLTVHWKGGTKEVLTRAVPLKKRSYPVQKLTVERKFVIPPPEATEKIRRDRAEMRAAVTATSPVQYWRLPLALPLPGEVTSVYGARRVFNGIPKNPHKGVDFDALDGDPVSAVDAGTVVLVSEHYYGGNTLVVDHGLGVMSAYLHLSGFNVKKGQKVARGDTVGFAGATGRVTGPHLHLSFYVLGESVNALPLLQTGE